MSDQSALLRIVRDCDVFFEGSLISKEMILQKYVGFFAEALAAKERPSYVTLHTGSICFDVLSVIAASLICITMDETDPDAIIASLSAGDLVLYKSERHRWLGIEEIDGMVYMKLEQDGHSNSGESTYWSPLERNKHNIRPYNGTSFETDGKGIRRRRTNRTDFIAYITGKGETEVPGVTGLSTVIVSDRALFDRIQKGVKIVYDRKSVGLLDIVTAAYYTESGGEYQFGRNPSKADPVLKVAGKVSVARDLVLSRRGNRAIGLMVLGAEPAAKGASELEELLGRKSLTFTHVSMNIDSNNAGDYVGGARDVSLFACTKEFLLQHSNPIAAHNPLTEELDRQIETSLNGEVFPVAVGGGCSWDAYKQIRRALFAVRRFEGREEAKKNFIISAHSLLNLFVTAAFPMSALEGAVAAGELHAGVSSPAKRIEELREFAKSLRALNMQCALVADALEALRRSLESDSPKGRELRRIVRAAPGEKIAVVVPKAYYADILTNDPALSLDRIDITTANRFDASESYDKIICLGDFSGTHFDALRCKAAPEIFVLLYDCEAHWFRAKEHRAAEFERKLNVMSGLPGDCDGGGADEPSADESDDGGFSEESLDLDAYIETISAFDVRRFIAGVSASGGSAPQAEISAVGRFAGGEQILFSKFYKAVVYDPSNARRPISETDTDKLAAGDRLVFTKRDDFTKNIVDSVFDALLSSGRLGDEMADAAEKALWWKEVLRDYRKNHGFSYRQLAQQLGIFGCTIQEQGVRQWLIDGSHIVGPRAEKTLRQIAAMTRDPYLLGDIPGYFEAFKIVRRQRKRILELIGKAIEDKLAGHQPPDGSELKIVYDNVENLSEILELETIAFLKEELAVPVGLVNKPIADMEVLP